MEKISSSATRMIGPDVIRAVAILMIVALHTIYAFTIRPDFFATKLWFTLEPIAIISRAGILLFFMLSGYLVLGGKRKSVKENWIKAKKRILIPLLFFGFISIIYAAGVSLFFDNNFLTYLKDQILGIVLFPNSPLWFLVALLILYLTNPLIYPLFSDEKNKKKALAIFIILLLYSILIVLIKSLGANIGFLFTNLTIWLSFLSIYIYGALVRKRWINTSRKIINLALIITGFMLLFIGDYQSISAVINNSNIILSGYFYEYTSLPVILLAFGLFNLLIDADYSKLQNNHFGNQILKQTTWLASLAFGIYLVHTFVVSIFTDILYFDFDKLNINVYLYNILNYILVLGLSIVIVISIKKTSKLKMIIGE